MRSIAAVCMIVVVIALGAGAGADGAPRTAARAAVPAATPGEGTPITEPEPELLPAFLPIAVSAYDARLPEPAESAIEGYVAALTRAGRSACAPATHVLLTGPEGTRGVQTVAVLHAARPGPALNLDFHLGEYIRAAGTIDLAPSACSITWRRLRVESITVLDIPPR